jgi:hypothetical protein
MNVVEERPAHVPLGLVPQKAGHRGADELHRPLRGLDHGDEVQRVLEDGPQPGLALLPGRLGLPTAPLQVDPLEAAIQRGEQLAGIERLGQVVVRPSPQGLDGRVGGHEGGHHHRQHRRPPLLQHGHHVQAGRAAQPHVHQGDVGREPLQHRFDLVHLAHQADVQAARTKEVLQTLGEVLVVLDDQQPALMMLGITG